MSPHTLDTEALVRSLDSNTLDLGERAPVRTLHLPECAREALLLVSNPHSLRGRKARRIPGRAGSVNRANRANQASPGRTKTSLYGPAGARSVHLLAPSACKQIKKGPIRPAHSCTVRDFALYVQANFHVARAHHSFTWNSQLVRTTGRERYSTGPHVRLQRPGRAARTNPAFTPSTSGYTVQSPEWPQTELSFRARRRSVAAATQARLPGPIRPIVDGWLVLTEGRTKAPLTLGAITPSSRQPTLGGGRTVPCETAMRDLCPHCRRSEAKGLALASHPSLGAEPSLEASMRPRMHPVASLTGDPSSRAPWTDKTSQRSVPPFIPQRYTHATTRRPSPRARGPHCIHSVLRAR